MSFKKEDKDMILSLCDEVHEDRWHFLPRRHSRPEGSTAIIVVSIKQPKVEI